MSSVSFNVEFLGELSYRRSKIWGNLLQSYENSRKIESEIEWDVLERQLTTEDAKNENSDEMAEEAEDDELEDDINIKDLSNYTYLLNDETTMRDMNEKNDDVVALLNETVPVLKEHNRRLKESGLDCVFNTFDPQKIEEQIGSCISRYNSESFEYSVKGFQCKTHNYNSFQPKDHSSMYDNSESDSLHSDDTARYILSSRQNQNSCVPSRGSKVSPLMRIKTYRLVKSKREALRQKYALCMDDEQLNGMYTKRHMSQIKDTHNAHLDMGLAIHSRAINKRRIRRIGQRRFETYYRNFDNNYLSASSDEDVCGNHHHFYIHDKQLPCQCRNYENYTHPYSALPCCHSRAEHICPMSWTPTTSKTPLAPVAPTYYVQQTNQPMSFNCCPAKPMYRNNSQKCDINCLCNNPKGSNGCKPLLPSREMIPLESTQLTITNSRQILSDSEDTENELTIMNLNHKSHALSDYTESDSDMNNTVINKFAMKCELNSSATLANNIKPLNDLKNDKDSIAKNIKSTKENDNYVKNNNDKSSNKNGSKAKKCGERNNTNTVAKPKVENKNGLKKTATPLELQQKTIMKNEPRSVIAINELDKAEMTSSSSSSSSSTKKVEDEEYLKELQIAIDNSLETHKKDSLGKHTIYKMESMKSEMNRAKENDNYGRKNNNKAQKENFNDKKETKKTMEYGSKSNKRGERNNTNTVAKPKVENTNGLKKTVTPSDDGNDDDEVERPPNEKHNSDNAADESAASDLANCTDQTIIEMMEKTLKPQPKSMKKKKLAQLTNKMDENNYSINGLFNINANGIYNSTIVSAAKPTPSPTSPSTKNTSVKRCTSFALTPNMKTKSAIATNRCKTTPPMKKKIDEKSIISPSTPIKNNDCIIVTSTTDTEKMNTSKGILLYGPQVVHSIPSKCIRNGYYHLNEEHLRTIIGERAARKFIKYHIGQKKFDINCHVYFRPPENKPDIDSESDSDIDVLDCIGQYGDLYVKRV